MIARMLLTTSLFAGTLAGGIFIPSGSSQAQPVCTTITPPNNLPRVVCSPTADFFRDQGVIDRQDHLQTGTYLEVPEARRQKSWPLPGSPNVQACRNCIAPDRQNAARLNALQ